MANNNVYIGVDVGGTKILGLLTDGMTAEPINQSKEPTPKDVPEDVGPAIVSVVENLFDAAVAAGKNVRGVGVGVPGLVDKTGVLRYGPNVQGVLNLNITKMIRTKLEVPAVAENDGYLAALVEHRLGAAQGHDHALLITQGTGVAGGLIIDGKVIRGANGFAGEPGHALVDPNGPMCACKQQGCWEAVSSGAGLANLARLVVAEGKGQRILELAGGKPELIKGEHVAEAGRESDADAAEVFDRFASWVAVGLSNLCALLDPSIVVLGGGLTSINDQFIDKVADRLPDRLIGADYRPPIEVVPAQFREEAGAVGAALRARDYVINGY